MTTTVLAAGDNNFLIPNGTFIVELLIFVIVLIVIGRFVVPPIRDAQKQRHDMVQKTIDDNQQATERFEAAEQRYREALAEARNESGKIRDEARAEGQRILAEMRERAQAEADEITQRGAEQLATQRESILTELRGQVDGMSGTLAGRIVGEDVSASGSSSSGRAGA